MRRAVGGGTTTTTYVRQTVPTGGTYWINPKDPSVGYLSDPSRDSSAQAFPIEYINWLLRPSPPSAADVRPAKTGDARMIGGVALNGKVGVLYGQRWIAPSVFFGPRIAGASIVIGYGLSHGPCDSLVDAKFKNGKTFTQGVTAGVFSYAFYPGVLSPAAADASFAIAAGELQATFERYPGLCYVRGTATWADGSFWNNIGDPFPIPLFLLRGRQVRNYLTGLDAWTDNPSYCTADYITSTQYGRGAKVNVQSVIDVAGECDTTVVNPATGATVKKHTLNLFLLRGANHKSIIDAMRAHFRCTIIERGGEFVFLYDKDRAPAMTFDPTDAVPVSIERLGGSGIPNEVKVTFPNAANNDEPTPMYARTSGVEAGTEIVKTAEYELEGMTDEFHGATEAYYLLNVRQNNLRVVLRSPHPKAGKLEPLDVLTYTTDSFGMSAFALRALRATRSADGSSHLIETVGHDPAIYAFQSRAVETYPLPSFTNPFAEILAPTALSLLEQVDQTQAGVFTPKLIVSFTPNNAAGDAPYGGTQVSHQVTGYAEVIDGIFGTGPVTISIPEGPGQTVTVRGRTVNALTRTAGSDVRTLVYTTNNPVETPDVVDPHVTMNLAAPMRGSLWFSFPQALSTARMGATRWSNRQGLYFLSDGWVDCGAAAMLRPAGNFSVAAWVWLEDTAAIRGVAGNEILNTSGFSVYVDAANQFLLRVNGAGVNSGLFGGTVPLGAWAHLAITVSGTLATTYINGAFTNSTNFAITRVAATANYQLGRMSAASGNPFAGYISDERFYDAALSGADVANLFNGIEPATAPKGRWKLDDHKGLTAVDATGNGNTGTIAATTFLPEWSGLTAFTPAKIDDGDLALVAFGSGGSQISQTVPEKNTYLELDAGVGLTQEIRDILATYDTPRRGLVLWKASSQYVTCGVSATLRATGDQTIAAWIYSDDVTVANQGIASNESFPTNGVDLFLATNNLVFRSSNGGSSTQVLYAGIPAHQWIHVAAVRSGGNTTLYVNGVAVVTSAVGTPAVPTTAFEIGRATGASTATFGGMLREVRYYNAALAAGEIANIYNGVPSTLASLKGLWLLTDGTGLNAADTSGNGNSGTLTNGPAWQNVTEPITPLNAPSLVGAVAYSDDKVTWTPITVLARGATEANHILSYRTQLAAAGLHRYLRMEIGTGWHEQLDVYELRARTHTGLAANIREFRVFRADGKLYDTIPPDQVPTAAAPFDVTPLIDLQPATPSINFSASLSVRVVAVSNGGFPSMGVNPAASVFGAAASGMERYIAQYENVVTLANGANGTMSLGYGPGETHVGGPTAAFSVDGFTPTPTASPDITSAMWLLHNASTGTMELRNQNAGATAVERIITPGGVSFFLAPGESVWIFYDNVADRWRVQGTATSMKKTTSYIAGTTSGIATPAGLSNGVALTHFSGTYAGSPLTVLSISGKGSLRLLRGATSLTNVILTITVDGTQIVTQTLAGVVGQWWYLVGSAAFANNGTTNYESAIYDSDGIGFNSSLVITIATTAANGTILQADYAYSLVA